MKSKFNLKTLIAALIFVSSMGLYSCLDDDDNDYSKILPNALVTVKHASDESVFLQLDDSTTLQPINMETSPFGDKEVRALVNYKEVSEPSGEYSKAVHINWIDSILTKNMAPDLGSENDIVYGIDPVEVIPYWVTIAEDGYLTLCFTTRYGFGGTVHYVNLLSGNNPDDPYEVVFKHNANGDYADRWAEGLVAFKLDQLPDTEGKTVKLTLKWMSFQGEKSLQFNYCTNKSSEAANPEKAFNRGQIKLK